MVVHTLDSYAEGDKHNRVSFCKVCGLEGLELTTDCPAKLVDNETKNSIARRELDFINGRWVNRS